MILDGATVLWTSDMANQLEPPFQRPLEGSPHHKPHVGKFPQEAATLHQVCGDTEKEREKQRNNG